LLIGNHYFAPDVKVDIIKNYFSFLENKLDTINYRMLLNAYRILVGKPEGKRPLGRPRRRWVDNIKIHLREIGWDGMGWIDLAQDRDQWRALVITV
jgi:hypothetical protein